MKLYLAQFQPTLYNDEPQYSPTPVVKRTHREVCMAVVEPLYDYLDGTEMEEVDLGSLYDSNPDKFLETINDVLDSTNGYIIIVTSIDV